MKTIFLKIGEPWEEEINDYRFNDMFESWGRFFGVEDNTSRY